MKSILVVCMFSIAISVIAFGQIGTHPLGSVEIGGTISYADTISIKDILHQVVTDWSAHDGNAFSSFFIEDGDFIDVNGTRSHGIADIVKSQSGNLKKIDLIFVESSIKMQVLNQGLAMIYARWEMNNAMNPGGSIVIILAKQQAGSWKIVTMLDIRVPVLK